MTEWSGGEGREGVTEWRERGECPEHKPINRSDVWSTEQVNRWLPRPHHTHLCTEGEVQSQVVDDVLQQVAHALVEGVVLRLQVRELHRLANDVLVEGPREEAVQQLVVSNGLCDHATHKLEVLQVVWVDV